MKVPVGTEAERPSPGVNGYLRYNNEDNRFEAFTNGAWSFIGGLEDIDKDTKIEAEANPDEDKLKFTTNGNLRMIIDKGGIVGINVGITPTQTVQLDVNGDIQATTYITTSDKRVKTNLKILDNLECLDNINNFDVYEYNFIEEYLKSSKIVNKRYQGLIAQDVNKVLPSAINYSTRDINGKEIKDFMSINQNHIISQLIGAVKELTKKVNVLEEKLKNI